MHEATLSKSLSVVHNKKSIVKLVADNVVYVRYHENSVLEPEDLDEAYDAIMKLTQGQDFKVISELTKYSTVSTNGRRRAEQIKFHPVAEAIIFESLAQRLLLKFYTMIRRNQHPFKIFVTYDDAFKWIKEI
ncbi:hypothetical protein K6119_02125 [Paracrocinitomix mangrovi]|uniref:DUF7793 family protein n=1 Tax=Paracrocinitomix mangrovi TaxID=2862509 RepID=UPI001C8D5C3A|nr:hypothetical protein [Paracrocinitomix mangrovi]UKN02316.1 hypothetical protein K6119_02125 [Paracrocinitomix mangrovi]